MSTLETVLVMHWKKGSISYGIYITELYISNPNPNYCVSKPCSTVQAENNKSALPAQMVLKAVTLKRREMLWNISCLHLLSPLNLVRVFQMQIL